MTATQTAALRTTRRRRAGHARPASIFANPARIKSRKLMVATGMTTPLTQEAHRNDDRRRRQKQRYSERRAAAEPAASDPCRAPGQACDPLSSPIHYGSSPEQRG